MPEDRTNRDDLPQEQDDRQDQDVRQSPENIPDSQEPSERRSPGKEYTKDLWGNDLTRDKRSTPSKKKGNFFADIDPPPTTAPDRFSMRGVGIDQEISRDLEGPYALGYSDHVAYNMDRRSHQQGAWTRRFNAWIGQGLGGAVVGGSIEGIGFILEAPIYYGMGESYDWEHRLNPLRTIGSSIREGAEGYFPIHTTHEGSQDWAPGDATWWSANVPGMLEFASIAVPGLGAATLASRLGRFASRAVSGSGKPGRLAYDVMKKSYVPPKTAAKAARTYNRAVPVMAGSIASRHSYNMLESFQLYEEQLEHFKEMGFTDDMANKLAGESAANMYRMGWWNIWQDALVLTQALKGVNFLRSQYSTTLAEAYRKAPASSLGGLAARSKRGVVRSSMTDNTWRQFARSSGYVALGQSVEETAIQYQKKASKYNALSDFGIESHWSSNEFNENWVNHLGSPKAWNAMLWGGLGGFVTHGGMRGGARIMEKMTNQRAKDISAVESRWNTIMRTLSGLNEAALNGTEKDIHDSYTATVNILAESGMKNQSLPFEIQLLEDVAELTDEELADLELPSDARENAAEIRKYLMEYESQFQDFVDNYDLGSDEYNYIGASIYASASIEARRSSDFIDHLDSEYSNRFESVEELRKTLPTETAALLDDILNLKAINEVLAYTESISNHVQKRSGRSIYQNALAEEYSDIRKSLKDEKTRITDEINNKYPKDSMEGNLLRLLFEDQPESTRKSLVDFKLSARANLRKQSPIREPHRSLEGKFYPGDNVILPDNNNEDMNLVVTEVDGENNVVEAVNASDNKVVIQQGQNQLEHKSYDQLDSKPVNWRKISKKFEQIIDKELDALVKKEDNLDNLLNKLNKSMPGITQHFSTLHSILNNIEYNRHLAERKSSEFERDSSRKVQHKVQDSQKMNEMMEALRKEKEKTEKEAGKKGRSGKSVSKNVRNSFHRTQHVVHPELGKLYKDSDGHIYRNLGGSRVSSQNALDFFGAVESLFFKETTAKKHSTGSYVIVDRGDGTGVVIRSSNLPDTPEVGEKVSISDTEWSSLSRVEALKGLLETVPEHTQHAHQSNTNAQSPPTNAERRSNKRAEAKRQKETGETDNTSTTSETPASGSGSGRRSTPGTSTPATRKNTDTSPYGNLILDTERVDTDGTVYSTRTYESTSEKRNTEAEREYQAKKAVHVKKVDDPADKPVPAENLSPTGEENTFVFSLVTDLVKFQDHTNQKEVEEFNELINSEGSKLAGARVEFELDTDYHVHEELAGIHAEPRDVWDAVQDGNPAVYDQKTKNYMIQLKDGTWKSFDPGNIVVRAHVKYEGRWYSTFLRGPFYRHSERLSFDEISQSAQSSLIRAAKFNIYKRYIQGEAFVSQVKGVERGSPILLTGDATKFPKSSFLREEYGNVNFGVVRGRRIVGKDGMRIGDNDYVNTSGVYTAKIVGLDGTEYHIGIDQNRLPEPLIDLVEKASILKAGGYLHAKVAKSNLTADEVLRLFVYEGQSTEKYSNDSEYFFNYFVIRDGSINMIDDEGNMVSFTPQDLSDLESLSYFRSLLGRLRANPRQPDFGKKLGDIISENANPVIIGEKSFDLETRFDDMVADLDLFLIPWDGEFRNTKVPFSFLGIVENDNKSVRKIGKPKERTEFQKAEQAAREGRGLIYKIGSRKKGNLRSAVAVLDEKGNLTHAVDSKSPNEIIPVGNIPEVVRKKVEDQKKYDRTEGKPYEDKNTEDVRKRRKDDGNSPKKDDIRDEFDDASEDRRDEFTMLYDEHNTEGYSDLNREIAHMESLLPNIDYIIINDLIEMEGGTQAFATFQNGLYTLSRRAPKGAVYHEGFHDVFNTYLTSTERAYILADARRRYKSIKESSDRVVEEKLAEEFRMYMLSDGNYSIPPRVENFFQKIIRLLRDLILNRTNTQKLFDDIKSGHFKRATPQVYRDRMNMDIKPMQVPGLKTHEVAEWAEIGALNLIRKAIKNQETGELDTQILTSEFDLDFNELRNMIRGVGKYHANRMESEDGDFHEHMASKILHIVNNWSAKETGDRNNYVQAVIEYLRGIGVVIKEEHANPKLMEESDHSIHGHTIMSAEYSSKDKARPVIKMLVALTRKKRLNSKGEVTSVISPITNLPEFVDFGAMWNKLQSILANTYAVRSEQFHTTAFGRFMDRLEQESSNDPEIAEFKSWLDEVPRFVQTQVYNAFNLSRANYHSIYLDREVLDDHTIRNNYKIVDSGERRQLNSLLDRWQSSFFNDDRFFTKDHLPKVDALESLLTQYNDLAVKLQKRRKEVRKKSIRKTEDIDYSLLNEVVEFYNLIGIPLSTQDIITIGKQHELGRDNQHISIISTNTLTYLDRPFGVVKSDRVGHTLQDMIDISSAVFEGKEVPKRVNGQKVTINNEESLRSYLMDRNFFEDKNLIDLAETYYRYNPSINESVSLLRSGQRWNYMNPTSMDILIDKINHGDILFDHLKKDPGAAHSIYLQHISETAIEERNLKRITLAEMDDTVPEELDSGDRAKYYFNLMLKGIFPSQVMGLSRLHTAIQGFPYIHGLLKSDGQRAVLSEKAVNIFFGYFKNELNRISTTYQEIYGLAETGLYSSDPANGSLPESERLEHKHFKVERDENNIPYRDYSKAVGLKHVVFPELSYERLTREGATESEMELASLLYDGQGRPMPMSDPDASHIKPLIDAVIKSAIKKRINSFFSFAQTNGLTYLDDSGNMNVYENVFDDNMKQKIERGKFMIEGMDKRRNELAVLTELFLNDMINRYEQQIIFHGEISQYASWTDLFKRTISPTRDKEMLDDGVVRSHFNVAFVYDYIFDSPYREDYIEGIKRSLKMREDVYRREGETDQAFDKRMEAQARDRAGYKDINRADALAYIIPRRWRELMEGLGEFTPDIEEAYNAAVDGNATPEQLSKLTLTAIKGVYNGYAPKYDGNGVEHIFLKYVQLPLFPQLTKMGGRTSGLNKVREMMEDQEVDELVMQSGVKTGGRGHVRLFDNDGFVMEDVQFNKVSLSNEWWGRQMREAKPKKKMKNPTQGTKNIFQGLSDKKRLAYESQQKLILGALSNHHSRELASDLGLTINEDGSSSFDESRLADILYRNSVAKGDPLASVLYETQGGQLKIPVSAHTGDGIQLDLYSLVEKMAITQRVKGGRMVQVSPLGVVDPDQLTHITEKGHLRGPIMAEDGSVQAAQVFLPNEYLEALPDLHDWTSEEIHDFFNQDENKKKIIRSVGYRIPGQGVSSISHVEVVGFLPPGYRNTIVVYDDTPNKDGSDFDYDKVDIRLAHVKGRGENINYIEFLDNENSTPEQRFNVLWNSYVRRKGRDKEHEVVASNVEGRIDHAVYEIREYMGEEWYNLAMDEIHEFIDTSDTESIQRYLITLALMDVGTDLLNVRFDKIAKGEETVQPETFKGGHIAKFFRDLKEGKKADLGLVSRLRKLAFSVMHEEAVQNKAFPEWNEFLDLSVYEQNTIEALENKELELMYDALSEPENYAEYLTSLDYDSILPIAHEIRDIIEDREDEGMQYFSLDEQLSVFDRFKVGDLGLSVAAVHNVHQSIAHGRKIQLPTDDGWVDVTPYMAETGVPVQSTTKSMVSSMVDIEKDSSVGYLNVNEDTQSIFYLLARAGRGNNAAWITAQPGIKGQVTIEDPKLFFEDLSYEKKQDIWNEANPWTADVDTLKSQLKKYHSGEMTLEDTYFQYALTRRFKRLKAPANHLLQIMLSQRIDSKGIPSTVIENFYRRYSFRQVQELPFENHMDPLEKTMLSVVQRNADFLDKAIASMFLEGTHAFQDIFTYALNKQSISEGTVKKMSDVIKGHVMSQSPLFEVTSEQYRDMFFGDNTTAKKLANFQKDKRLEGNYLLKILTPVDRMMDSNISFRSKRNFTVSLVENRSLDMDSHTQAKVKSSWWDLINHEDSDIAEFGLELVKHSLYTSGGSFSLSTFYHLIPPQVLEGDHANYMSYMVDKLNERHSDEYTEVMTAYENALLNMNREFPLPHIDIQNENVREVSGKKIIAVNNEQAGIAKSDYIRVEVEGLQFVYKREGKTDKETIFATLGSRGAEGGGRRLFEFSFSDTERSVIESGLPVQSEIYEQLDTMGIDRSTEVAPLDNINEPVTSEPLSQQGMVSSESRPGALIATGQVQKGVLNVSAIIRDNRGLGSMRAVHRVDLSSVNVDPNRFPSVPYKLSDLSAVLYFMETNADILSNESMSVYVYPPGKGKLTKYEQQYLEVLKEKLKSTASESLKSHKFTDKKPKGISRLFEDSRALNRLDSEFNELRELKESDSKILNNKDYSRFQFTEESTATSELRWTGRKHNIRTSIEGKTVIEVPRPGTGNFSIESLNQYLSHHPDRISALEFHREMQILMREHPDVMNELNNYFISEHGVNMISGQPVQGPGQPLQSETPSAQMPKFSLDNDVITSEGDIQRGREQKLICKKVNL